MAQNKGYEAHAKYLRISPTKVRAIARHLRRKPYSEAIAILDVLPHKGARLLKKVIRSAAANALFNNKNIDEDMLYIGELQINQGPTMKRMWPRARGRADRLLKRSAHISVVLQEGGTRGTES